FSIEEMIRLFDLDACNRSGSTFNTEKLQWLNQQYMQALPADTLGEVFAPYLASAGIEV
ncbi:MAG TPA: glutamate--tRNA ligase, partial [Gammaproteobacteria bacterium]|nr:glutamate--tRNA ligase [Gammaproteobacteria bacterium]